MDFTKYHLLYNAAAHFAAVEKYPEGLTGEIGKGGMAGIEALCFALELLSTQGELARRDMGHDRGETIDGAKAMVRMTPWDAMRGKTLVLAAISRGLKAEDDEDEEIDEILMENQKKRQTDDNAGIPEHGDCAGPEPPRRDDGGNLTGIRHGKDTGGASEAAGGEIDGGEDDQHADMWVHAIDLQGYGTQQFVGSRTNIIAGWSEKVLDFVRLAEDGIDSLRNRIDAIEV